MKIFTGKSQVITIIKAETKASMRIMVADQIKKAIQNGHEIEWNCNTKNQVNMFKDTIDFDEKHDKEITTFIVTTVNGKSIQHHQTTRKNPKCISNPFCDVCHKKVTKVFDDVAGDEARTPVKVCKNCREICEMARNI